MSEIVRSARDMLVLNKLVIFYGALCSLNALSTAIVASFMNTEWATLSATSKFLLIIVILQNWSGTMLAFINKTLSRVESGRPPVGDPEPTETEKPKQ